ncbi:hypothetical protein EJB05_09629 [Eragrostis curvula]|uniref:Uncharacterized protein n=1 Tax=Eragrostis curvula TaxID=38414 RepID=A0A5J9W6Y0_9POAL|nr:hypothetical protein EJB05_09629 [Eragrostis curvula]
MGVGFGVSAAVMAAGLISLLAGALLYRNKPPKGSIFTPIARVFAAAISNSKRKQICPASSPNPANPGASDGAPIDGNFRHANKFRFLDNACIGAAPQDAVLDGTRRPCTMAEVQQAKTLLAVLPIFACTIVSNTALAQLQTFSVQQGYAMDTRLASSSFHIPPASLQAIPYAVLLLLVPAYELLLIPLMRRLTRTRSGISPLQRIGAGLCFSALSMVAAALFLVFGVSELLTNVGLMEFFYKQGGNMQTFLTALFYSSFSFGFFLSSVLVSLVNRITARGGGHGWLGDNDLNKDRLDLFYWMLAALIGLSFLCYLVCARWYNSGAGSDAADRVHKQEIAENDSSGMY